MLNIFFLYLNIFISKKLRPKPKRKLIIAVDFDGTIVQDFYPHIGPQRLGAASCLKWLKERGHTIILNTCRTGKYLDIAQWYCTSHFGFKFDQYNENDPERIKLYGGDCRKISADLYLDDKSFFPGWWIVWPVVWWMERRQVQTNYSKGVKPPMPWPRK